MTRRIKEYVFGKRTFYGGKLRGPYTATVAAEGAIVWNGTPLVWRGSQLTWNP